MSIPVISGSSTGTWKSLVNTVIGLINAQFAKRPYVWADSTARLAQTGMTVGEMGYQTDTQVTYRATSATATQPWSSPWITYTPTLTNVTLGTGSVTEYRYQYTNGTVRVDFYIRLGTGGALTGAPTMTLPATAVALRYLSMTYDGVGSAQNAANNVYPISIAAASASTTSVQFFSTVTGAYAALSATAPHTWALNSVLQGKFRFEPA